MTRDEFRVLVYDRIDTLLPVHYGSVPHVIFDNTKDNPPANTTHARVYITETSANRMALGQTNKFHRYVGFIFCQVYSPKETGTKGNYTLLDAFEKTFRDTQVQGPRGSHAVFKTPKMVGTGSNTVDGFYFQTLMIPYHRDGVV